MSTSPTLRINRAPVLTLWAAVVAERLGFPPDTALTMGQALAGMTAYAKGVRLGIYSPPELRPHEPAPPLPAGATGAHTVVLLGRQLHLADTGHGQRAISKGELVKPEAVERYLRGKFGEALDAVRAELQQLAAQFLQTAKHLPGTAIALERLQASRLPGVASDLTT